LIGDWVDPRAGLDAVVKGKGEVIPVLFSTEHHDMKAYWGVEVVMRKIPTPCQVSYSRSSSPQTNAIPLSYPGS
jgi:hypothetical protein